MTVRGFLPKLAVTATLAAAVALATPSTAMAFGWPYPPLPSSKSELSTGNAGVGLVGPHVAWLNASEHTKG
ncbi:hypothetical protein ACWEQL_21270 [Kitasatospora sp. NPDC004240]